VSQNNPRHTFENLHQPQVEINGSPGQTPRKTYLNPNRERTLNDGAYLFPTDWNLCLSTRKPEPSQNYKEQFVNKISDGYFKP